MESHALHTARAKVAALDLSAENATIAQLTAELEDIASAESRGQARLSEIASTLMNWRGPDAHAVAKALLSDDAADTLANTAPSKDALTEEREALQAGIVELRKRADVIRDRIRQEEANIARLAAAALSPLADAIANDARRAARDILAAYAAVYAINRSTKGAAEACYALREPVRALSLGVNALLPPQPDIEAPAEVREILAMMVGKSPSLHNLRIGSIPMP